MSELDGTRTISIPGLSFNYVGNRLESIGCQGELYYRERGTHAPHAGSRWHNLFGTPERAARTEYALEMCRVVGCEDCPARGISRVCSDFAYSEGALLEWLRGDA